MHRSIPISKTIVAVVMIVFSAAIASRQLQAEPAKVAVSADRFLYHRAFELALWAMPATDSFATREAVIRDLGGKPNDVAINTKPMNSDVKAPPANISVRPGTEVPIAYGVYQIGEV